MLNNHATQARHCIYLELIAHNATAKLATTSYDLRKDTVRGIYGGILPVPADFKITHGPKSGTLLLHVARLVGAKSYDVQMAQGDPTIEGTSNMSPIWQLEPTSCWKG